MIEDEERLRRFLRELDRVQPGRDLEQRALGVHEPRRGRRRRTHFALQLAAVLGIVLLALAAVSTMLLIPRSRPATPAAPGKIAATYPVGVGGLATGSLSVDQDGVWIPNRGAGTVVHIDAVTGATRTLTLGGDVTSVLESGDVLWVGRLAPPKQDRGEILKVDPNTGGVLETIPVPSSPARLYLTGKSLLVSTGGYHSLCPCNEIYRLDVETGKVVATIPVTLSEDIAVTPSGLWVAGAGAIVRIDPETNQVIAKSKVLGNAVGVAASGGWIWATQTPEAGVVRIDPSSNTVVATVQLKNSPLHLIPVGGSLWVTSSAGMYRLNATTGSIEGLVPIPDGCDAAAASGASIWCASRNATYRIQPRS